MSNQSYTSSQIISTPSGGGALKGIGETFAADLHTGTGNFSVPIALPPGRKGFQPELNLVYSTGNGNGPFGLGWQLSIPGVSRKTAKGVPRYDDARDTFILSGAEDLVAVDKSESYTRFRPRTEGLFARIDRHHDATNDYWEVHSKDGLVSRYGTPATAGSDPAVIADPADRTKIFSWKLTQTTDPFGNRIEYEYERDSQEEDPRHWDQLYLKKIHYVDYRKRNDPDKVHFLVSVAFIYEDDLASAAAERPDPFSDYRAGFEIRTRRRCKRIEIRMHTETEMSELVRTYAFIYLDERLPASELPINRVSLLSRINVTGHNGAATEQLPPLEFVYSRFEPKDARDFYPVEGPLPARSLANPELDLVDLSGDGLPDILELNGSARYWRNLGNGRFDLPREMREAPAGLALTDADVQLLDADGDARIDLMVTRSGLSGYFPLQPDGEWDRRSFQRYRQAPSVNLEDPEVHLVDLTGDGVTDAVRSGSRLECFFNHPQKGWNETRFVERKDLDAFPNVNFSDPRVKWADMTGDGLQDIVLVHDGNVEYWPNLGRGNWGRRVHMQHSPRFPYGYDPRRILIGDVDGDGAADFVYVDHCKVTLWVNRSGNSWSEPVEIDGTPVVSDQDSVSLIDLLGSGIRGVLWSSNRNASNRPNLFFLDFTGRVKPYLLNRMTNHLGAQTRVAYEPSIAFYLQDRQLRKPWQATLPFPVQVVSRVEVIDEISGGKLTTAYRYHHGYWDGDEREFRGFGRVEQFDTEIFDDYDAAGLHGQDASFNRVERTHFSPPTLTKTWFHQGPVVQADGDWIEPDWSDEYWTGDPHLLQHPETVNDFLGGLPDRRTRRDALRSLRGSVLRTELYALDGSDREDRPYTVTEFSYNIREQDLPVDGDTDRRRIFFPHTLAQRTTQWERGDEPMTRFTFTGNHDAYGQPRWQAGIAVPRGRDFRVADAPGMPYPATHTTTDYAQKDTGEVYITDRTARTTTYEILNDGSLSLFDLKERIVDGTARRKMIGQTLSFYDGLAFTGLPFGEIGEHGVLKRSEALVLTDEVLQAAYPDGDPTLTSHDPPYFAHTGSPPWPDEYPQPFAAGYPTDQHADATRPGLKITPLSHGFADAEPNSPYAPGGYFVAAQRLDHDPNGLVVAQRDPLGRDSADRDTRIAYDPFNLLPVKVTDPAGLETKAEFDYRLLQPKRITDPNHNVQAFTFSPLGLPTAIFVRGKDGEGDAAQAGTRFEYDLLAFTNSPEDDRQPVWVRTIRREHHDSATDIPLPERNATLETVEYSDGFDRLVQTRTQAEDIIWGDDRLFGNGVLPLDQTDTRGAAESVRGHRRTEEDLPNVRVSGWTTYDNKGQVVEQYEPFFTQGWDYLSREEAAALRDGGGADLFGRKVTRCYDPRGQVIRSVNPDGSEQRMIYGVPGSIAQPDVMRRDRNCDVVFEPTPWEVYTYDANDNAGCTHRQASGSYAHHWDTPSSVEFDALGRTILSVERTRDDPQDSARTITTKSRYDIVGNLIEVTDARDRLAFQYIYSLIPGIGPLRIDSIDAGRRQIVIDAAGQEIERRDGKGSLTLQNYDMLLRPTHLWARDKTADGISLRQRSIYADDPEAGLSDQEIAVGNFLGRLYGHFDEAGRVTIASYDFKGNPLETTRQVLADSQLLSVFNDAPANDWHIEAFQVDWRQPPDLLLDTTEYTTTTRYDALNRAFSVTYPKDIDGTRSRVIPTYNRAGALKRITIDDDTYVQRIAYNARGQRTLIAYGNGLMTRQAYDMKTFRLKRLRTDKYVQADDDSMACQPSGPLRQDFAYTYDRVGNILKIKDRTPDSGIPNTTMMEDALDRLFTYDPLYQLRSATGRECDLAQADSPWQDVPGCQDPTRTRFYSRTYQYDDMGNLQHLHHQAAGQGIPFNREFAVAVDNNRLNQAVFAGNLFSYQYDANGNMTREGGARHFEWNHSDQLKVFRSQINRSEPSVHAQYRYDAAGKRVLKLVRKQGGRYEVRVYIGALFEHYRWGQNTGTEGQNNVLHVMDDRQRLALVRRGPAHPDDTGPGIQFHLVDHLGSGNIVVDENGRFINREEHYPYGETSFGSYSKKRYRFTGKERDEESGLNYHESRYYPPVLNKWLSCDHLGPVETHNLYVYTMNNPMTFFDSYGYNSDDMNSKNEVLFNAGALASWFELPTQVIRDFGEGWTSVSVSSFWPTLQYHEWFNQLRLKPKTARRLQYSPDNISQPGGWQSVALGGLYHELTHFHFDVKKKELSELSEAGVSYYQYGKLKPPTDRNALSLGNLFGRYFITDPSRVFKEAAGEYVGHRVLTYVNTLKALRELNFNYMLSATEAMEQLVEIRHSYNQKMKKKTFGYQEKGGEVRHTTEPIFEPLKNYLDREILGGKIPDNFDNVKTFKPLMTFIESKIHAKKAGRETGASAAKTALNVIN